MRLFLIRHAQTSWNVEGRAQGHTDIALDENGLEQARRLADSFREIPLVRVLASDLSRSRQTAEAITRATGAKLELIPDLRERRLGDWEGVPYEQLWAPATGGNGEPLAREHVIAPNGESISMVWQRLEAVTERLRMECEPTAVIAHGGSGSLLLARLLNGTIDTARAFRFANASVTELRLRPDGHYMIARYNDTSHLSDLPAREGSLEGSVP